MLYKYPGRWELEPGDFYDYIIVDAGVEGEIDKAIAEGWRLTMAEAKALYESSIEPPPVVEPVPVSRTAKVK